MTVANDGGHGLGIRIINSCELALYLRGDALRVIRAHAQTNDAITDFFHLSRSFGNAFDKKYSIRAKIRPAAG